MISFFIIDLPRLKHAKRILRWPGLRPSTAEGIERTLSALEKWMSSWEGVRVRVRVRIRVRVRVRVREGV